MWKKRFFRFFSIFKGLLFFLHPCSENLKMQDINLNLLLQEYGVKTYFYWGLFFLGFFEKCATITFYTSFFTIFFAQKQLFCGFKHEFDVKFWISLINNVFALKKLQKWVGHPEISCKVKMFETHGIFLLERTVPIWNSSGRYARSFGHTTPNQFGRHARSFSEPTRTFLVNFVWLSAEFGFLIKIIKCSIKK